MDAAADYLGRRERGRSLIVSSRKTRPRPRRTLQAKTHFLQTFVGVTDSDKADSAAPAAVQSKHGLQHNENILNRPTE